MVRDNGPETQEPSARNFLDNVGATVDPQRVANFKLPIYRGLHKPCCPQSYKLGNLCGSYKPRIPQTVTLNLIPECKA